MWTLSRNVRIITRSRAYFASKWRVQFVASISCLSELICEIYIEETGNCLQGYRAALLSFRGEIRGLCQILCSAKCQTLKSVKKIGGNSLEKRREKRQGWKIFWQSEQNWCSNNFWELVVINDPPTHTHTHIHIHTYMYRNIESTIRMRIASFSREGISSRGAIDFRISERSLVFPSGNPIGIIAACFSKRAVY